MVDMPFTKKLLSVLQNAENDNTPLFDSMGNQATSDHVHSVLEDHNNGRLSVERTRQLENLAKEFLTQTRTQVVSVVTFNIPMPATELWLQVLQSAHRNRRGSVFSISGNSYTADTIAEFLRDRHSKTIADIQRIEALARSWMEANQDLVALL